VTLVLVMVLVNVELAGLPVIEVVVTVAVIGASLKQEQAEEIRAGL
jgi:hypothetical protein